MRMNMIAFGREYTKIRPRRGAYSDWVAKNPVLLDGELVVEYPDNGIVSGNVRFKIGDGFTDYNHLPYAVDPATITTFVGGNPSSTNLLSIKYGTTAQWMIEDPVLEPGEIVFDITLGELKVGDGVHRFSELRYIGQTWERNDIYDFGDYDATETVDVHPTGHVGHTHTVDDIIGLGTLATQDTISIDDIDTSDGLDFGSEDTVNTEE